MNERSRNVAVGLTTLVGLIGLLGMMLVFGYVPRWIEGGYVVRVHLPDASGVSEGSRVTLDGIDVGTVESVRFASGADDPGVVVRSRIREDVRLPEPVQVSVHRPFIGGSPTIEFRTPRIAQPTDFLPTDGSAVIRGEPSSFAGGVTGQLRAMLKPAIADIHRVANQFEALSAEWARVGQNVNLLIEPRTPEQVDRGEAPSNLTSVIARTDARLTELERVIEGVQGYTNDTQLREDIRQAAANARQFSEDLPARVDELSENVNTSITAVRGQYIALADDLAGVIHSMEALVDAAREGDGTVAKLVQDPSLYNNLNETVVRLQETLDELHLLIEKWGAEGVPVQF